MSKTIKVVRIKKIIDGILDFVSSDYLSNEVAETTEESILYRLLYENQDGDYNFYTESISLFVTTEENPRKIGTSLMFNQNTNGAPHIHVRESTRGKGQSNFIGNVIGGVDGEFVYSDGDIGDNFSSSKSASYEIMITSLNQLETTLISEVVLYLIEAAQDTLMEEFTLYSANMKELLIQSTTLNSPLYTKSIAISTEYETTVPSITKSQAVKLVNFMTNVISK